MLTDHSAHCCCVSVSCMQRRQVLHSGYSWSGRAVLGGPHAPALLPAELIVTSVVFWCAAQWVVNNGIIGLEPCQGVACW